MAWRDLANPNAGGSEVVVDHLARGLLDRGHRCTLLAGGPVGARPYPVLDLGGTYDQYLRAPVVARRGADPAVVVDVANGMTFASPLWWRGPRVLLVHHLQLEQWHEYYFPTPVAAAGEAFERRVLARLYRSSDVVAVSESTRDELVAVGVPAERITVVHSGVGDELFGVEAAESATPQFLALGRMAPNKNLDRLLDVWARVRPVTGGRLVIAGDGPERARLADRDDPGVDLVGHVDEATKRRLLGESWLLVHTANREGWGLVVMEAAAAGTPSLAIDTTGLRDAIVHGCTGELVADDDAMVAAWTALAADPARRRQLGEQARARAATFTWDGAVDRFEAVLEAAVDRQGGRRRRRSARRAMPTGVRRSAQLLARFRQEQTDPEGFYTFLADDTVAQLQAWTRLEGAHVLDVGGGAGFVADALRARGASCTTVEYDHAEMHLHGRTPVVAIRGDAQRLPVATGAVDVVHSSNVLEHVPDPEAMLAELVRVVAPGSGIGYVSFPNWLSPWGGHETSPWHYLGGRRAVDRYVAAHGHRPKNEIDVSLFAVSIARVLRWFGARPDVEVLFAGPRYLPRWTRPVVEVPGARELVTWNLLVVFRRRGGDPDAAGAPRPGPARPPR